MPAERLLDFGVAGVPGPSLCLGRIETSQTMPIRRPVVFFTVSLASLLALTLAAAGANKGAAAPEMSLPKPPLPAIESLQIEPPALTLENGRDARLVLVWGVTKDGRRFDLSDSATFKIESNNVVI